MFDKRYVAIVDRVLPIGETRTIEDALLKDSLTRSSEVIDGRSRRQNGKTDVSGFGCPAYCWTIVVGCRA
ncbi:MAG: hypothetical protein MZU97_18250 [Bacillus subtilis]|nr:hypothetical protein [Bacillus subtilis]